MRSDDLLYEMSNFGNRITGLPTNLVVWVRADSSDHGHSRYRIKVKKDREWAAIYTVGTTPKLVKDINQSLSPKEDEQIKLFVTRFSSLLVGLIDGRLTSDEFALEVVKRANSPE
jgi:hypothetical protein